MTDRDRRYRPIPDLTPFELVPLIGAGATLEHLRTAARGLAGGWALERLTDGAWRVVGWTGTADKAQQWVDSDEDLSALAAEAAECTHSQI